MVIFNFLAIQKEAQHNITKTKTLRCLSHVRHKLGILSLYGTPILPEVRMQSWIHHCTLLLVDEVPSTCTDNDCNLDVYEHHCRFWYIYDTVQQNESW